MSAFLTLYTGLAREGPGTPEDVAWAAEIAGLAPDAAILDAGCGTGGDIEALLDAAPHGTVTAIDQEGSFIRAVRQDWAADDRVWAEVGDMSDLKGEYDLIWSAGAVYFLGVTQALAAWRDALRPGGAVAFSHPCHFTATPSQQARGFWEGFETTDAAGIDAQVRDAGYRTRATRKVANAGWETYYLGLGARAKQLRPGADAEMTKVLDAAEAEIAAWRAVKDETGYLISVVKPA